MARELIVKRLARELDLSAGQREEVEKIVCRTQAEMFEIRHRNRPQVEAIIIRSIAEIKEHLSPDQRTKLDTLHEKARHRWLGPHHEGKGPPPDCE